MKHPAYIALLLSPFMANAQAPTWADDVACIVYSHCTGCHRPGGISGEQLNLTSYDQALAHRDDIAAYTTFKVMPPWPPDQTFRRMAHERALTQDEIDIIATWAAADGPEGDQSNAPSVPVYNTNAEIDNPSVTAIMDEYVLPPSTSDLYRCFVLPIDNPTDNFIKRLEVIPGNRQIVHHVLVYQDTSGQAQSLDDAEAGPGYTSFGGIGVENAPLVGIWVPGSPVLSTPLGMGIKLFAGADLVIQVHYPTGSEFQSDSTRVNMEFSYEPFTREIGIIPALDHLYTITDGPLIIAPNEIKTFHAQSTTPIPATITAIGPHAHLICTSMKAWAITPANDSIPLISIPDWDFHWQGMYEFRKPIYLPTGSVLHGEATYDNTADNEDNPNDPPAWVTLGEATTDEMMLFYFAYSFGFPSDTLVVVDDSEHGEHHENCATSFNIGFDESNGSDLIGISPVPATDLIVITMRNIGASLRILDLQGRPVIAQRLAAGANDVDVARFARGTFITEVRDARGAVLHRSPILLQ